MTDSHRGGNEIWEKCQMRMRLEKLRVEWKQLRMQDFLDPRKIKRRVFRPGMVPMDQQRSESQQSQKKKILEFQIEAPRMACTQSTNQYQHQGLMVRITHPALIGQLAERR